MDLLRTLKSALPLLALAWPLAATGPAQPRPFHAGHGEPPDLPLQAFQVGEPDGCFLLDCRMLPWPPQELEVFGAPREGEAWTRLVPDAPAGGPLRVEAPAWAAGGIEFLVMHRDLVLGRASYEPLPADGVPGEAEVRAALALCQELPVESPRELDQDRREDPREPGEDRRGGPLVGFPEGRAYLQRIAREHHLEIAEIVQALPDPRKLRSGLYKIMEERPNRTARALSYHMAVECARALNALNQQRNLRAAPFTAEELFLGGRTPQELSGADLLRFILVKDRHLHRDTLATQSTRLGLEGGGCMRRMRGERSITSAFVEALRAKLDLALLGLTEADLGRLRDAPVVNHANHPGTIRALALYAKVENRSGKQGKKALKAFTRYTGGMWLGLRTGSRKVSRDLAENLSAFHNKNFPGEPPTTPDYFLGK